MNDLRKWIQLVESHSDLDTHLQKWVSGNPSDQTQQVMHDLANQSETRATALTRNHHSDPKYNIGQVVDFPALSFSRNDANNRHGIASEWSSKHKSIFHIDQPRRGFDIPHDRNYGFGAHHEKETVVGGRYRVTNKENVPEPHTSGSYTVPKYTFLEL